MEEGEAGNYSNSGRNEHLTFNGYSCKTICEPITGVRRPPLYKSINGAD